MKKIYLTVDTECHDFNKIDQYIHGRKKNKLWGINKILELAKEYKIPVNFFVDVGEAKVYGNKFMQEIVDEIHAYKQPVYFHLHPDYISGDKKRTFLWMYNYEEKKQIFYEAYNIYKKFANVNDKLIFRAGRYGIDNELVEIFQDLELEVLDLSFIYSAPKMCHLRDVEINTINRAKKLNNVIILPTTRFVGFDYCNIKRCIGLDSADATLNEFKRFIRLSQLSNIVYTMHSWNFIRKWFFLKNFFVGDKAMIRKFKRSVVFAEKQGFRFSKLSEYKYCDENDELINLCGSTKGKILGIFNNFIRFHKIARLNKKYFIIYFIFYLVCIALILILGYLCFK